MAMTSAVLPCGHFSGHFAGLNKILIFISGEEE
jgi:hypothetical protein